jgi:hypothetical protein
MSSPLCNLVPLMLLNHTSGHVCPIFGPPILHVELLLSPFVRIVEFAHGQAQRSALGLARRSERTASAAPDFDRFDAGNRRYNVPKFTFYTAAWVMEFTMLVEPPLSDTHRSTTTALYCRYR